MKTETPLPERKGHNFAFIHLPNNPVSAPLASVFNTHWIQNIEHWFIHSDQDTFNECKKYWSWVSSEREGHSLTIFGLLLIQTEINICRTALFQLYAWYLPKHYTGPLPKSLLQILSKTSALTLRLFLVELQSANITQAIRTQQQTITLPLMTRQGRWEAELAISFC